MINRIGLILVHFFEDDIMEQKIKQSNANIGKNIREIRLNAGIG